MKKSERGSGGRVGDESGGRRCLQALSQSLQIVAPRGWTREVDPVRLTPVYTNCKNGERVSTLHVACVCVCVCVCVWHVCVCVCVCACVWCVCVWCVCVCMCVCVHVCVCMCVHGVRVCVHVCGVCVCVAFVLCWVHV